MIELFKIVKGIDTFVAVNTTAIALKIKIMTVIQACHRCQ